MVMAWRFFGKEAGNFRWDHYGGDRRAFLDTVFRAVRGLPDLMPVFSTDCTKFTNRIALEGRHELSWSRWFIQAGFPADGAIVTTRCKAIAMFTADCPIVAVFDPGNAFNRSPRVAMLHAGFRCLVTEDSNQKSIIEILFSDFKFPAAECEVFYGFGIGPCCYGANHIPEVQGSRNIALPISRAIRGPRKGQNSVDLCAIIRHQLLKSGVREKSISCDRVCTSCEDHGAKYHSHCRDGKSAGRNAAFVWME